MWDSKSSGRDTVDLGPRRDLAKELFDAARQDKAKLKAGFYYSLYEWHNPAYTGRPATKMDGPLHLSGAQVSGTLDLSGTAIHADPAVQADGLTVNRDLLGANAVIDGGICVTGARIGGTVRLDGTRVGRPGGHGLAAEGIVIEGGLSCRGGFQSYGELSVQDARVGRRCVFSGARLSNPGGIALNAERLTVEGGLFIDDGFAVDGEVLLRAAHVAGSLSLAHASLANPGGYALNAPLMELGSGLRATPGFVAIGEVFLDSTQVRGSVTFDGGRISNPDATVLSLRRLTVTGRLSCSEGFRADGEIVLINARVEGGLEFHGAALSNPSGRVLALWEVNAGGGIDCCEGFTATGTLSIRNSRIAATLCLAESTIDGDLHLRGVEAASLKIGPQTALLGSVDLRHTHIGVLDDVPGQWPARLLMNGFTYDSLEAPLPVRGRLGWLAKEAYQPQPYEQLTAVYHRHGHDEAARDVLLAKQRRRRAGQGLGARAWGYLQDWTVGYGYRPLRAALWLAALLLVGTLVFAIHEPPAVKPGEAPPFNAFLYTLDLLLPIIGFGQESAFGPRGAQQWLAAAMIAAGWIPATTILAGLTRALSRR
ncbi:alpha-L-fucosidase [Streptosporangium sp. CA-135522]|uniref:alpha-L-fucosidase n=1 Tax=Streptosporangium sp. CA-135522 TaxID=3240072 RepID=UPI003D8DB400